jgi:AraC-like DNA-binding protein
VNEPLSWIFAAGVAQGLFLVGALATLKVRNSRARWFLVAALAAFTLMLGEEFLDAIGASPGAGLGLAVDFAVGPSLYLFVSALAEDSPNGLRRWPLHYIPFGLATAFLLYLHAAAGAGGVTLDNASLKPVIGALVIVKVGYYGFYLVRTLTRPLAISAKPSAAANALRGVRIWLWLFCGAALISAFSFFAFYLWPDRIVDSDWIGALTLVASIFGLGYFALANRNVFDVRSPGAIPAGDSALAERALSLLRSERGFLEPEFSLQDFAHRLGVSETRLSQALNGAVTGGFYAAVNDLRLEEFKRLAADAARNEDSILTLALEAGFGSKATFYRYFKQRTGMTPTAFRKEVSSSGLALRPSAVES